MMRTSDIIKTLDKMHRRANDDGELWSLIVFKQRKDPRREGHWEYLCEWVA